MTKESEPMTTGAPTSPMVTRGRSAFGETLAADLELAAGDGRRGRHFENLRTGVGRFRGP